MSGPVDDVIEGVAQEMLFKHPPLPVSPGERFARQMKRVSRDYDVRDRIERGRRAPLVIRDEKETS